MNPIAFILIELLTTILDLLICMVYFDMLFSKKKPSISTFIWIIAYFFMEIPLVINTFLLDYFPNSNVATITCTLTSILGLFLISMLYNASQLHRIFAVITFQVLAGASEICSYCLLNLFIHVVLQTNIASNNFSVLFISKLILCLLVFLVGIFYRHKREHITAQYSIHLLYMPFICLFIICCLWGSGFRPGSAVLIVLNALVSAGLISMCLLNYVLLNIQLQNQELKDIQLRLEQQSILQQMKYDQSVAAYKESRRTIHDSKKHLLYVRECARQADNQTIVDYINQNLSEFENSRSPINTGNLAIDALIGNAVLQARKMDIPVTTNIQINIAELPLPDYDLCIILGNLTDNALTAVQKTDHSIKPCLMIELFMTKEQLVCHFVNTTVSKEAGIYDPEQAFKDNRLSQHGYGLYNVCRIVEKYHGLTHFEQKEREYEANVIIPLSDPSASSGSP